MSTFYDPATIRRLAKTDKFFAGAAWVLDQQDAARIDTTDYDSEWTRTPTSADHLRKYENAVMERANELQARFSATLSRAEARDALKACLDLNVDPADYDSEWARVPKTADPGTPRIG